MVRKDFMLRLMKYKRVLIQLRTAGLERVFSNNLGDAIGISAALVRKDLARIDMQGNRRGGYDIDVMLERLSRLLGGKEAQEAILVGCGNLGRALLNHEAFYKEGIKLVAGFDISPISREIGSIPIYEMERLEDFIKETGAKVALLTVPAAAAADVRDRLLGAGIRGILNFAPMELKCSGDCVIHNVNIGLEIENLFFLVNSQDDRMNREGAAPSGCIDNDDCEDIERGFAETLASGGSLK
jgi:redox-sensing transcriptional repressor